MRRRSTRIRPRPGMPSRASTRRPFDRAIPPGARSGFTRATCAMAGTSLQKLSRAGSLRGTVTLTGFAPTAPRIFSNGPLKSSGRYDGSESVPAPVPNSMNVTSVELNKLGPSARPVTTRQRSISRPRAEPAAVRNLPIPWAEVHPRRDRLLRLPPRSDKQAKWCQTQRAIGLTSCTRRPRDSTGSTHIRDAGFRGVVRRSRCEC